LPNTVCICFTMLSSPRLPAVITEDHAVGAQETEALVIRLELRIAHEIDHVEIAQVLEHPTDKLRADTLSLIIRQDFEVRDVGGQHLVRDRGDEANHVAGLLVPRQDDGVTAMEQALMRGGVWRVRPADKKSLQMPGLDAGDVS